MRKTNKGIFTLVLCAFLGSAGVALPTAAQALASQVQALYPPEAGELVFVDLQVARRSPYFGPLKAQLLPERFRELERLAAVLGVDFNRNVDRLSWGFINRGDPARAELVGVAEGAFYLDEVEQAAAQHKLGITTYRDARVYLLGANEQGQEFVFAFRDNATCLFGFRGAVQAMLDRGVTGGPSLLDNTSMRGLVEEVNRRASIWLVMDGAFTQLGVRQFLGEAAKMPGVETLAKRVRSATVRIELDRGLEATIAARCATTTDALWFSAFLEAALFFHRQQLNNSNPTLARVLSRAQLERHADRLSLAVAIPESDLATLIRTNSFALSF